MQLQTAMQAAIAKVSEIPRKPPQIEITWNFIRDFPGITYAQLQGKLRGNAQLVKQLSRNLAELKHRGMVRVEKVKPDRSNRKVYSYYTVTSTYELLPTSYARKTPVKVDPTKQESAAVSHREKPTNPMDKALNAMTLSELREAHRFLSKLFG